MEYFLFLEKGADLMAKGKYHEWLEPEGLLKIEGWARDGLTDEQIAFNMRIGIRTLYEWKDKYPQISQSLKRGKEVIDRMVENALLKRALGYSYKETTRELVVDKDTGEAEIKITKIVEKEVVPDTTAQIFWLKNRKPNEWRDKRNSDDLDNVSNVDDGFMDALNATAKEDWNEKED